MAVSFMKGKDYDDDESASNCRGRVCCL